MTTPSTSADKTRYKFSKIVKDLSGHTWKKHGYTGKQLTPTGDALRQWMPSFDVTLGLPFFIAQDGLVLQIGAMPDQAPEPEDWQQKVWYRLRRLMIQHAKDCPARFKNNILPKGVFVIPQSKNKSSNHWSFSGDIFYDPMECLNADEIKPRINATIAIYAVLDAWESRQEMEIQSLEEGFEAIYQLWVLVDDRHHGEFRFPLEPIIEQWQMKQIPNIEPDRRKTQIAPAFLKESQMDDLNAQLPVGQFHEGADIQAYLPGCEPSPSVIVAALPLDIYASAENSPIPGGSGAPLAQRLFISGLLAYPYGERQRDGSVKLTTSLRDLRDWAYPNGWTRKYDLPRIIKALHEVHNMRIRWKRRRWNVVQVFGMPTSETQLDDPVPLRIELPEGVSGNGAMIDVFALRLYGTNSAPKFRAWIRLAYLWDDAKIKNGGFRIFARRPKVLRNSDGYLTDTQGKVIRTGNLYFTPQGWKFRDGNIPQTAWYHPLAVVIGDEPNPQVHKVPVLSDEDMIQLFFDNQRLKPSAFRKRLYDSRKHAEQMEKEGRIKIETDQIDAKREITGWRILQLRLPKQVKHVYR